MCTGAEIPAALAATAASAGAAGASAAVPAAATAGAAGLADAGITGLSAIPAIAGADSAGLLGAGADAGAGLLGSTPSQLAATGLGDAATSAPTFGAGGIGMTDAGGSTLAGAPGPANPLSIGFGNFQNSSLGQGLNSGMNALGNYNKAQTAMGLMNNRPRPMQAGAPMSMTNKANQQQTPFAQQFGPGPGAQQMPDAAKMMILKRMGLLGGM